VNKYNTLAEGEEEGGVEEAHKQKGTRRVKENAKEKGRV
jgi:hypothetical protein